VLQRALDSAKKPPSDGDERVACWAEKVLGVEVAK
jgi:hypothetical protein